MRQGTRHSDETRARIGEAQRGRKRGPMAPEQRAKISATKTGKKRPPRSAEWCARLSAAHAGKRQSMETRLRISQAKRRIFAERGA